MVAVRIGSSYFVNRLILGIHEQFKIIVMLLKPNIDFVFF